MFKILDGRDKFYQWDKNRKLIVEDSSINEVHFCNRYGNTSIIRATYQLEGKTLVDVPNVILQESFKLHTYAFDTEYTKHEDVFEIVARTKPEDYINTEEDVKLWDELAQKLIDLEGKVDGEGIQAAVIQYLTDNPPEAGATQEEAAQIAQNKEDIATLRQEFDNFEIPEVDFTGYATEKYVDDKIADIDFPEGADLTGYATKSYVDTSISNIKHPTPDLNDYAKKSEIPSTTGLASTTYVDNAIKNIDIPEVNLDGYATEDYVDEAIANIDIPTGGGSGAAEVSIGTTEPANGEVLWINPEGDNNYLTKDNLVNGGSMMENADGTLSTVIGGSRTLKMAGGAVVQTKDGVAAWTNANANRGIFQFGLYDKTEKTALYSSAGLTDMSFSNTTNYSIEYNVHYGGLITPHKYNLKYASSTQLLFVEDNELFTSLEWNSGWSDLCFAINTSKVSTSDFYNQYKIGEIKLYIGDVYDKTPIDGAYIPIGRGLIINNGAIASSLPLDINSNYDRNDLIQNNNSKSNSGSGNCAVLGHENFSNCGQGTIVLGRSNQLNNRYAANIAIGDRNIISGNSSTSVLVGVSNTTNMACSYAFGEGIQFDYDLSQTLVGHYNANASEYYSFVIGNGTTDSDRRNAMAINGDGNAAFSGTVTSQGADYAEYFEWADGNPESEDRVGYIVALAGDKIHKAQAGEEVLGIISGTVAVLGDNYEWHWNGKYLTDDFGRVIYDLVDKYSEPTEEEPEPEPKFLGQVKVPRINPEWDETKEYKNRANRAEWDTVGMFGKLFVRDDGSCVVGGYATTGADGLATLATGKTNMYVMDRINDNIVKVLLK